MSKKKLQPIAIIHTNHLRLYEMYSLTPRTQGRTREVLMYLGNGKSYNYSTGEYVNTPIDYVHNDVGGT